MAIKFRRIYQLPYLSMLVWPVVYAFGLLVVTPLCMCKGLWEGLNRGGERVNYYIHEYRYRPWVALPKVWEGYNLTLARKNKLFPNGIIHMKRRLGAE